jgi:hypothetical protein
MASRKHHKQDASRPTKARARRERTQAAPTQVTDDLDGRDFAASPWGNT